ncbi:hypothetical protein LIER_30847 [Lithospermum erythrorhizon]|uniref:Uncharacterized protein n=1 Tax=Lithospermum erythrorhizon TaxID=34254 RepID=A0AAV3RP24_LITER
MGQLAFYKLSVKYVVLHKADVRSVVTTNINESLARVLYVLGSDDQLNMGQVIFEQIVDHAKSNVVLKPIGFLSLTSNLLRAQHPRVLTSTDAEETVAKPFTISHKLFTGILWSKYCGQNFTDVPLQVDDLGDTSTVGHNIVVKFFQEEIKHLEGVIQSSLAGKSFLEARVKNLPETKDLDVGNIGDDVS